MERVKLGQRRVIADKYYDETDPEKEHQHSVVLNYKTFCCSGIFILLFYDRYVLLKVTKTANMYFLPLLLVRLYVLFV